MLLSWTFLLVTDASQVYFLKTAAVHVWKVFVPLYSSIPLTQIHIDTLQNRCFDRNKCWFHRRVRSAVRGTVKRFSSHLHVSAISFNTRCRPACNQINKQCKAGKKRDPEKRRQRSARGNTELWTQLVFLIGLDKCFTFFVLNIYLCWKEKGGKWTLKKNSNWYENVINRHFLHQLFFLYCSETL